MFASLASLAIDSATVYAHDWINGNNSFRLGLLFAFWVLFGHIFIRAINALTCEDFVTSARNKRLSECLLLGTILYLIYQFVFLELLNDVRLLLFLNKEIGEALHVLFLHDCQFMLI